MSRIGKQPIALPKGVKYTVQGKEVLVEGPKGKLKTPLPEGITLEEKDGHMIAKRMAPQGQSPASIAQALIGPVASADTLTAGNSGSLLSGGAGADTLVAGAGADKARSDDLSLLLLEQAQILDGELPDDPAAFTARLNRLVLQGVA